MVPNDIWLRTEWLSCRRTSVLRCVERYCAAAALKAAERGWEEAVPENAAERAGALLFAAANAMRLAGVDAEEALTFASKRFCTRCLQQEQDGIFMELCIDMTSIILFAL